MEQQSADQTKNAGPRFTTSPALLRRQAILDRLEQSETCTYEELAQMLGVSSMTIRRDIEGLARRGAVIKTMGGAQKTQTPSYLYESALHSRTVQQRAEKRAMAQLALELLGPSLSLYLDGSTTCLEIAKLLARHRQGLTIVTNSALVCLELSKGNQNKIVGIGGHFDVDSFSFVGPQAENAAAGLFVDVALTGTRGFVATVGAFESSAPTFRIKQVMACQSKRLIVLADHTKFGQRALEKVFDISQIHTLITDDMTPRADLEELEQRGVEVHSVTFERASTPQIVQAS